jgi:hypothetical protein
MYLTRILLSIVFVLFASTALAAKKEKDLICHVGNEEGPAGETYLDDPGCTLTEENGYFCPDAGKIDLILVPANAKHIGNPAHAYEGIPDYVPFKEEAGGNPLDFEDGNGDGIDDGCEPDDYQLTCLCWDNYKLSEFVTLLNGWYATGAQGSGVCGPRDDSASGGTAYGMSWLSPKSYVEVRENGKGLKCAIERNDQYGPFFTRGVTDAQYSACVDELNAVMAVAEVCKVP